MNHSHKWWIEGESVLKSNINHKGRAKKARVDSTTESVEAGLQCMRNLNLPIDDRARSRASDMIQQAVFEESHDADNDPEICIRQFLQGSGVRDASMDSRVGPAVIR